MFEFCSYAGIFAATFGFECFLSKVLWSYVHDILLVLDGLPGVPAG